MSTPTLLVILVATAAIFALLLPTLRRMRANRLAKLPRMRANRRPSLPETLKAFRHGHGEKAKCAVQDLLRIDTEDALGLRALLRIIEERLQHSIPDPVRKKERYAPEYFLRDAFRIRQEGNDFELVHIPEKTRWVTKTEAVEWDESYAYAVHGVSKTMSYPEEVVVVPEDVIIRKKEDPSHR